MHNSTVFCPSNENVLGSMAYDAQVLINRWQNAADNGYGFCSQWGEVTDTALDLWDLFCRTVLRNLVAIAAWACIGTVRIVRSEITSGRLCRRVEVVAALAQVVALVAEESLSLDGDLCPCIGNTPSWDESVVEAAVSPDAEWAFARFGRREVDAVAAEVVWVWAQELLAV